MGGVVQDAEDITQETLLAAVKGAHRFRGKSRLKTWLFSIASHKVADHWRRQGRRRESPLPEPSLAVDDAPLEEDVLERVETRHALRAALLRLPPHYRCALVLRYVEGLPVAEVAQTMRRSVKSVESILVRAKRMMGESLAGAKL